MGNFLGIGFDSNEETRAWSSAVLRANLASLRGVAGDDGVPDRAEHDPRPLGCGRFGCAYKVGRGMVLKITSEADEAGFAEAWMRLGDPSKDAGMVRYHAAVRLPDVGGVAAYALWREEAHDVGRAVAKGSPEDTLLKRFKAAALDVRDAAFEQWRGVTAEAVRELKKAKKGRAPKAWGDADYARYESLRTSWVGQDLGAEEVASMLGACCSLALSMRASRILAPVGEALGAWIDRGILLADAHRGNVGLVERGGRRAAAITDPGKGLLLDGSHDWVKVPGPEVAARLGWRDAERRENPPRAMGERELFELFLRERANFARKYPSVSEASLEVSDAPCNRDSERCRERDVAHCAWRQKGRSGRKTHQRVVLVRRALSLPHENVVAVIRHELGHLADPRASEPGPGGEARADRIAEEVGGQPIRYDRIDLQTVGPGRRSRPSYLHQ